MTIKTDRLLLRPVKADDAEEVFRNWASDPEVTRYLTWSAHESIDVTKMIVARWLEEEKDPKTVRFGITIGETGELIGMIDVVKYVNGAPEIGYCLSRKYWNRGYMTEACTAFLGVLRQKGFHKALIRANVDNIGSNRVIQKCGFRFLCEDVEDVPSKNLENVRLNRYEKSLD